MKFIRFLFGCKHKITSVFYLEKTDVIYKKYVEGKINYMSEVRYCEKCNKILKY